MGIFNETTHEIRWDLNFTNERDPFDCRDDILDTIRKIASVATTIGDPADLEVAEITF